MGEGAGRDGRCQPISCPTASAPKAPNLTQDGQAFRTASGKPRLKIAVCDSL